ncbi:MAG: DUF896 domain-containing protein [Negativicutes bacterium]
MITKELIARINALSRKQRLCTLTEEEKSEQALLRRQYLENIKEQVRGQLESAHISEKYHSHCDCGCHGRHRH